MTYFDESDLPHCFRRIGGRFQGCGSRVCQIKEQCGFHNARAVNFKEKHEVNIDEIEPSYI